MLEAKGISYAYKKHSPLAVNHVSFALEKGHVNVLLGPNGAGKSTLIGLLTGNLKPQEGFIEIDGEALNNLKLTNKSRLIGYVPQHLEFGDLSVFDTILLGRIPYFHLSPCHRDREAVIDIMEKLGISSFASRLVNELSGGEKQLVGIAMALVRKPKVLILDEPTSNLDLANQIAILRLIKKAALDNEVAVLISMHDLNQATLVGDRFLIMQKGELLASLSKEDLNEEIISKAYGINVKISKLDDSINIQVKEQI